MLDGLGNQVVEQGVWKQIHSGDFRTKAKINNNFLKNNPVDEATEDALFTDPFYGLNTFENYAHWHNLLYTTDELKL